MRRLTVSLAILSLGLASAVPITEEKKIYTKNYYVGDKDVIYSVTNIVKDELVYAVCEGNEEDKKCKVNVESTDSNDNIVRSCDVNLRYKKPYWNTLELVNSGYSKAIFVIRYNQKTKFIIVNMSNCHVKEVTTDLSEMPNSPFADSASVLVVPHNNSFDIIFSNKKLCESPLCKATFDYDGNVMKEASSFGMTDLVDNSFYLETDNNLLKLYNSNQSQVYVIRNGELDAAPLFVADNQGNIATSTEENRIGFCNYTDNKIACQQFNDEGKSKIFEAEATVGDLRIMPRSFHMLNLEKGMLTVMTAVEKKVENLSARVLAVSFDEQGKRSKVINTDFKTNEEGIYFLNLYKNKRGEPCVLGILFYYGSESNNSSANSISFSRTTKCFTKDELN